MKATWSGQRLLICSMQIFSNPGPCFRITLKLGYKLPLLSTRIWVKAMWKQLESSDFKPDKACPWRQQACEIRREKTPLLVSMPSRPESGT